MKHTTESIGSLIQKMRKKQGLTQQNLALVSGTGVRFIIELERGKPSCSFSKVLNVLQTLGIEIYFTLPLMKEE